MSEITSRRFGPKFEKPCKIPTMIECALWVCQVADCCRAHPDWLKKFELARQDRGGEE